MEVDVEKHRLYTYDVYIVVTLKMYHTYSELAVHLLPEKEVDQNVCWDGSSRRVSLARNRLIEIGSFGLVIWLLSCVSNPRSTQPCSYISRLCAPSWHSVILHYMVHTPITAVISIATLFPELVTTRQTSILL